VSQGEYTIGIDLGTSNCAVAFASLSGSGKVTDFPIAQLERPGETRAEPLLPSALYAPLAEEKSTLTLDWSGNKDWAIGRYARSRGAKVPGRLITSAKSWLCHPSVDRTGPILPWGGAADVPKLSPVTASALLLQHMSDAWDHAHPQHPLAAQEVVITVPASFDEAARALTVSAARNAGIEHFTLLEEPQAAFYDFSHRHAKHLANLLANIRLVLVVDVGGGTTDFTLVQVAASPEGPILKRIAVGDHLILGGDNMDNALARRVEEKLGAKKLSSARWIQVVQAAREAKEKLLRTKAPAETKITIAGEGSRLLGGTLSTVLTRQEVEDLVIEGFFPQTTSTDLPAKGARGGIQEMGLPYVADPAIPRHLAAFLRKHATGAFEALGRSGDSLPRPDAILLNGGVFNSERLSERLLDVLSTWWPGEPRVTILEHDSLDLSVARGAACYGLVRHGRGRKISGGTSHSFYVGVAAEKDERSAVCLLTRGVEEGETVELKERVFKLHVGRPVQFPIYTSTADRIDRSGDLIRVTDELTDLPPIQTVLKSPRERAEKIPVYLRGRLTEIGTVELWCVSADTNEQWRLEFDVRGTTSEQPTVTESLPERFGEAKEYIAKIYGNRPGSIDKGPKDVRQLWSSLERLLGPRETWSAAVLRQLWGELFAGANKRRRSPEHERIFFQLLGYSLRPGFGYTLDEWRCEQSFRLFSERTEFHKEKPNWNEFWIMWRRISGGLSPERQAEFWDFAKRHLAGRLFSKSRNMIASKGPKPEGIEELVRAAAALEHLPSEEKIWLGELICERLNETKSAGGPWAWSLGRIGSRATIYGSAHNVIAPSVAARWLELLLSLGLKKVDGSAFAAAQIARRTGDRLRDLDDSFRQRIIEALRAIEPPETWLQMVIEVTELKTADEARVLGDTLPIGLQLAK
jgi:molecular chaperone DnaK (HSP70)